MSGRTEVIGNSAFSGCVKLKKIVIPGSVVKIGKKAFFGCKAVKKVIIKTVKLTKKSVGAKAFKGLGSKVTVKVPKSVKKSYTSIFRSRGLSGKARIK